MFLPLSSPVFLALLATLPQSGCCPPGGSPRLPPGSPPAAACSSCWSTAPGPSQPFVGTWLCERVCPTPHLQHRGLSVACQGEVVLSLKWLQYLLVFIVVVAKYSLILNPCRAFFPSSLNFQAPASWLSQAPGLASGVAFPCALWCIERPRNLEIAALSFIGSFWWMYLRWVIIYYFLSVLLF